jgi:hypothetical protein
MAREACDPDKVEAWSNGFWTITQEELERFAALVANAEREACASVADEHSQDCYVGDLDWHEAIRIAKAIRARGTT